MWGLTRLVTTRSKIGSQSGVTRYVSAADLNLRLPTV